MTVYALLKHTIQSEYTEPRYFQEALDATEIIKIYLWHDLALDEIVRLKNLLDKDGSEIDTVWYEVKTFELD